MGVRSIAGGSRAPNVRVFTSDATYTSTPGAKLLQIEAVSAGGGSPAVSSLTGGVAFSGGGTSGTYVRLTCLPSDIEGAAIVVGQGTAGNGGATTIGGTLVSCTGGASGTSYTSSGALAGGNLFQTTRTPGPPPATTTIGTVINNIPGEGVPPTIVYVVAANAGSGWTTGSGGGSNPLGTGGWAGAEKLPAGRASAVPKGYGSGAGSSIVSDGVVAAGVNGANGVVIITEYF